MTRGQGSLEYLIMIAVIIAITTVVTLIAVTYLGNQQGTYSLNNCKSAAAACKASLSANPLDKCSSCDTSCIAGDGTEISTSAVKCCKMGKSDSIYAGATGTECTGCVDNSECTGASKCCINNQCQKPACTTATIAQDCGTTSTCQYYECANPNSCPPTQATCVLNNKPDTTKCIQQDEYVGTECYVNEVWTVTQSTFCDGSGKCARVVYNHKVSLVEDCADSCRVCSGGSCREPTSGECGGITGCKWCTCSSAPDCSGCTIATTSCPNYCYNCFGY